MNRRPPGDGSTRLRLIYPAGDHKKRPIRTYDDDPGYELDGTFIVGLCEWLFLLLLVLLLKGIIQALNNFFC